MKVLLSWLKEYVEINLTAEELADKLTNSGFEVENIFYTGKGLDKIITGEIIDIQKHSHSENLFVCKVNTGSDIITIISAAGNLFTGAKVPIAISGTILPNDKKIETVEFKGIKSEGMLCSKTELCLAEYAQGIFILDEDVEVGKPLKKVIDVEDVILDISVTPNRPDCLSIRGIAREVAAITGKKMKNKKINLIEVDDAAADNIDIEIKNFTNCARYIGKIIKDVKIKPSPYWMQFRLESCGIRAINNIVDVTNYILLEYGHPLHSFDYDKLIGKKIIVRSAYKNEKIKTIDDVVRILNEENLVIADAEKPVAVAGVMGGCDTEVSETTKNIMLESAYFNPASIRKTSRFLNLFSEASYRFERGTDIINLAEAAEAAASLIAELGEGKLCRGTVDINNGFKSGDVISLNIEHTKKILGIEITETEIKKILELLELKVQESIENEIKVIIPSHRLDLVKEIDLIEEVARLYGYDKIEWNNPVCDLTYGWLSEYDKVLNKIKNSLSYKGLKEIITYSFISPQELKLINDNLKDLLLLFDTGSILKIRNPLSVETSILRPTLLFNLLNTVKFNAGLKNVGLAFYETGKVFGKINKNDTMVGEYVDGEIIKYCNENELPFEKEFIGCIISKPLIENNWLKSNFTESFFLLKTIIENILIENKFKNIVFHRKNFAYFQPGQSAVILNNGRVLSVIGKVHPDICNNFDISENTIFAELDYNALFKQYNQFPESLKEFSKFPSVSRDIAIIVKEDIEYQSIKNCINKLDLKLLEAFNILDEYKGAPIEKGYKNIAISFTYRSKEKTLVEEDIREIHQTIFNALVKEFEAKTR